MTTLSSVDILSKAFRTTSMEGGSARKCLEHFQ